MNGRIPALGGTDSSRAWFERAQGSLAGGISSSSRLTSTGPHPYPLYMVSGSGTRIRDVDGNDYVDYLISYGSAVLGHAPAQLVEPLGAVLRSGTMFGTCNTPEVELAELICEMVPCAELVRFANSGSEAVQGAVRAARGCTGRSGILKFEGHYHGWSDTLAISNRPEIQEAGPYTEPHSVPHSPGYRPEWSTTSSSARGTTPTRSAPSSTPTAANSPRSSASRSSPTTPAPCPYRAI